MFKGIRERIREGRRKLRRYVKISRVDEIARRYFVMNSFDGSMTVLGIISGAYVGGIRNPNIIVLACVGSILAMAVSGFSGAFLSERAERIHRIRRLERSMLVSLRNSVIADASRFAVFLAAMVDALSPSFSGLIAVAPFFLCIFNVISIDLSFLLSFILNFCFLFFLGVFLGRITQENRFLTGLVMLFSGCSVAFVLSLISFLM